MDTTSRIPRQRGNHSNVATTVVTSVLLLIGISLSNEDNKLFALFSSIVIFSSIYVGVEMAYRLCLVNEERYHLGSRYAGMMDILGQAFDISPLYITASITSIFLLVCICLTYRDPLQSISESPCSKLFYLAAVLLIFNLLKPKNGALYRSLSIGNMNGLDFGSAMAYSMFNGYLNIVLPHKGNEQKGIRELMSDFEAVEGITFDHKKLIVLIPLSLDCPPSVDVISPRTEKLKSLESISLDRAGVRERVYKNTPYSIIVDERTKAYVCIEYATPLKTLQETINRNTDHSNIYKLQRKDIVLQFYLTLQAILDNDPDCRDCCDLLLYDDKTETGAYVDVGQVILDHINKSKNRKKGV